MVLGLVVPRQDGISPTTQSYREALVVEEDWNTILFQCNYATFSQYSPSALKNQCCMVTAMSFHVHVDGVHVLVVLTVVEIGLQLPCANIYDECSVLMCMLCTTIAVWLFTFLCSASCVPIVYYLVVFCLGKTPQVIGLMCLTKCRGVAIIKVTASVEYVAVVGVAAHFA